MKKMPWSVKTRIPRLIALLCLLITLLCLYNENTRQIQEEKALISQGLLPTPFLNRMTNTRKTNHKINQQIGPDNKLNNDSGSFDWSKACAFTKTSTALLEDQSDPMPKSDLDKRSENVDPERCDLFSGKWVFDNSSYPLYKEEDCPYMSDQLACRKYGRLDSEYQNWRWQPHNCSLTRWNASQVLEKLRGKRLMFVGDSLNRGQWISMVCLLQSALSGSKKSMSPNAALTIFRAEEYNATVEFYWAPLLVESNSDDPVNHRFNDRIIRPDSLLKHASHWEKADILVFNTYLWWRRGPKLKLLWRNSDGVCEEASGLEAMKLALEAWAGWVASNVNPLNTQVLFVTMSPTHLLGHEWRQQHSNKTNGNCFNEKAPIEMEGYWGSGSDVRMMRVLDDVLGRLRTKVSVLNITQLSEYRKDGHPSIYRKFWETITPEQVSNPSSYADCIHWCLPGVPDIWNELLFNLL